ncbi:cupredoxin domain-containing protein [Methanosphaerula palustris]|uniref:Blue (Type 1) copper domain protein n=1 Tax=Methanosphaerula palustris (strain ATCC BAA-1556 / DSM 19958 / E1-9c) TaxID=521011 RepID=B8GHL4_METPE|nr:cupredoxin domain-containing protein [Methanosphaerula palustris]ACL16619.1 blue (type 1) copper domain protein [Methanosphaerula palustris E1-9c]
MRPIFLISTLVILCIVLLMTAGCTSTTSSSLNMTTSAPVSGVPVSETTITGSTTGPTSQPSAVGQTTQVTLVSVNYAFDKTSITVPAGSHVQLTLDNQDTGIPHNVAVYTSAAASTVIFKGEVITGPKKITYTFDAPTTPGTYYFRCDIHPNMNGAFIVQ